MGFNKRLQAMTNSLFSKPVFIFSIFANILMLVAPLHMMQVYDRVLASGSQETLFYITLIGIAGLILFGACETIRTRLAQRLAAQYAINRAEPLFDGVTEYSKDTSQSHDMLRHFNTIRAFLPSRTYICLYDLPFAPLFLVILFLVHYQIGILTVIGLAALIGVALLNYKNTAQLQAQSSQANSNSVNFAMAVISRNEDIKAMGLLPQLLERWGGMSAQSLNTQDAATAKTAFYMGLSKSVRQILQISIMAWGAFLVLNGDMSGGLIFAASMVSGRALQPVEQFIGGWESLNRAKQSYEALEAFIAENSQIADHIEQPEPVGKLLVNEVSFATANAQLLDKISFSLTPGDMLGVIGPSGAGKSTLARIIAGAVPATSGSVSLDGCEQKNWLPEQWGQYVGYLSQDIMLFPGTIAENIARMAVHPNEKKVVAAARAAGAHELINSLPDAYMTNIGDGNVRLSGGQKQRIALARALYTSPKLLVLDEPNAHLDDASETQLMNSLQNLKGQGVTIVVVSQRGKLLKIADRIISVNAGTMVEMRVNVAQTRPPVSPSSRAAHNPDPTEKTNTNEVVRSAS